jgi:ABC-type antimicrobial peptide transport system permease subunit
MQGLYRVGFTDIDTDTPVINRLRSLNFFSLFLGLIMSIIVTVLAFLCITLVYSLLMINVETRTFEMGVMRMIGLQRNELVQLLMTQALMYAVPGFVFGIAFSQVRLASL